MSAASSGAPIRVVYIAGNGRSGSTLLDRTLGQLPGAISLGEMRFLFEFGLVHDNLCECGVAFRGCPFWSDVTRAALGVVDEARARELARQSRRLLWTPALPRLLGWFGSEAFWRLRDEHADAAGRLYRAIAERSGATWLIDSSKLTSYALLLARIPGIELHVVHLVRDSRAVAFSWQRLRLKPEVTARRAYMPVRPPLLTALRWNGHNLLACLLARAAKSHVRVRYEDLVRAPRGTVEKVAASVGIERPDLSFVSDGAIHFRRGHSVAGNPSRFQSGTVSLRLDEEWRRSMRRTHRGLVTLLTLPQMLAYGYHRGERDEPSAPAWSQDGERNKGVAHG
jgi:hypothetical protein